MALSNETQLLIKLTAQNTSSAAFGQLNNSLKNLESMAIRVGAAIGSALVIKDAIQSFRTWGTEINTLTSKMGISGIEAARWNYQARVVGTTADDLASSFEILANNVYIQSEAIAKGTSDFDKLGISVLNAQHQIRPTVDIMNDLRVVMRGFDAPSQAIIEKQLFGKSGGKLHEWLTLTDEDIHQLDDDLKAMGVETDAPKMKKMERDALRLGEAFNFLKIKIGAELLPIFL